tara:strand:+ start:53 stop:1261 length:1209 start_codon:yes stop_codon:yes gene_type:complete
MLEFIKKSIYLFFILILSFFVILLVILIKKIILIRFGQLETRAVGHYGLPVEIYLSEKDIGLHNIEKKHYDIWIKDKDVANKVLLKKWKKYLNIFPHHFIYIWFFFRKYKFGKDFLIPFRHWQDYSEAWPNVGAQYRDINNALKKTKCHFSFDESEKKIANNFFEKNNINRKVIAFFSRDPKYRDSKLKYYDSRNSSIECQIKAIEEMSKNYFCVRMGSDPEKELKININNFIDYSFSEFRSELNDLYILSKSYFIVSTGSGFDQMGMIFRTPVVLVNATEAEYRYNPLFNSPIKLYIPKKIYSEELNRLLTFSEIFKMGANKLETTNDYIKQKLKLINNSPKEIFDVVNEMEKRLSNKWIENKEDIELQKKYWDINSFENMPKFECRIGANFLKENLDLLK